MEHDSFEGLLAVHQIAAVATILLLVLGYMTLRAAQRHGGKSKAAFAVGIVLAISALQFLAIGMTLSGGNHISWHFAGWASASVALAIASGLNLRVSGGRASAPS